MTNENKDSTKLPSDDSDGSQKGNKAPKIITPAEWEAFINSEETQIKIKKEIEDMKKGPNEFMKLDLG